MGHFVCIIFVCTALPLPLYAQGWSGGYLVLSQTSINHNSLIKSSAVGGSYGGTPVSTASQDMMNAMKAGMRSTYQSGTHHNGFDFKGGYNWVYHDFLLGVEGAWNQAQSQHQYSYNKISPFAGSTFTELKSKLLVEQKIKQLFVFSGRLGYIKNNFLIYGRLGVSIVDAAMHVKFEGDVAVPASLKIVDNNYKKNSIKYGLSSALGVEYKPFKNWFMRLEYSRLDLKLGSHQYEVRSIDTLNPNFFANTTGLVQSSSKLNQIQIGIGYKF